MGLVVGEMSRQGERMSSVKRAMIVAVAVGFCLSACGDEEASSGSLAGAEQGPAGGKADQWGNTGEGLSFEAFRERVYCEPDTDVCVVEGDLPVPGGEAGLRAYYDEYVAGAAASLSVAQRDRADMRWPRAQRFDLAYCVSDDFGERKAEIVEAMASAARTWEGHAHVKFRYASEADARCRVTNEAVVFPVTVAPEWASYFARAFFPDAEGDARQIRVNLDAVDRSMARTTEIGRNLTLDGIMRHELGHVLGFRHEHTRPESGSRWCFEDDNYRPVTEYDASSVMHYPQCNGDGDWSLTLTQTDQQGAAFFYPDFERYPMGRCEEELDAEGFVVEGCEPVAHQLVELANSASREVLDDWVGLDRRAVEELVDRRERAPFRTLPELREVRYFERVGVRKLYDYLYVDGRCPEEVDAQGLPLASCLPVAHRILALANTADYATLDDEVRLDRRAAENIVAARAQQPFETLAGLWLVDWVKTRAVGKMYAYLYGE